MKLFKKIINWFTTKKISIPMVKFDKVNKNQRVYSSNTKWNYSKEKRYK